MSSEATNATNSNKSGSTNFSISNLLEQHPQQQQQSRDDSSPQSVSPISPTPVTPSPPAVAQAQQAPNSAVQQQAALLAALTRILSAGTTTQAQQPQPAPVLPDTSAMFLPFAFGLPSLAATAPASTTNTNNVNNNNNESIFQNYQFLQNFRNEASNRQQLQDDLIRQLTGRSFGATNESLSHRSSFESRSPPPVTASHLEHFSNQIVIFFLIFFLI